MSVRISRVIAKCLVCIIVLATVITPLTDWPPPIIESIGQTDTL